ncbi:MAG: energy transducer TonB [Rhodocyclaceae bacterium]
MNVSDSLAIPLPGRFESPSLRPRPDDTRSASPTGRAILLLLVGTAHFAALWTLSQTKNVTAIAPPEPLTVTMIELAQPSAPPEAVVPIPTPASSRQQATPRVIESQPRTVAPVRPPQPSEHAPRISAEDPAAEAVEESTPISPPPDTTPSSIEASPSQRSPAPAAAAPAAPSQPRFDAAYLNNPAPSYPALARRLGEEGTVRIRVWVTREGRAGKVELSQSAGSPRLDRTALETVSRWRFEPARERGEPVDQWVIVPIKFKLENPSQ